MNVNKLLAIFLCLLLVIAPILGELSDPKGQIQDLDTRNFIEKFIDFVDDILSQIGLMAAKQDTNVKLVRRMYMNTCYPSMFKCPKKYDVCVFNAYDKKNKLVSSFPLLSKDLPPKIVGVKKCELYGISLPARPVKTTSTTFMTTTTTMPVYQTRINKLRIIWTTMPSYTQEEKNKIGHMLEITKQNLVAITKFSQCPEKITIEYIDMPDCMCKGVYDETICLDTIRTDYDDLIVFYKLADVDIKNIRCISGAFRNPEERANAKRSTTLSSELTMLSGINSFVKANIHEIGHGFRLADEYCYNTESNNPTANYTEWQCTPTDWGYCQRFHDPASTCNKNTIMGFLYPENENKIEWSSTAKDYLDKTIQC